MKLNTVLKMKKLKRKMKWQQQNLILIIINDYYTKINIS